MQVSRVHAPNARLRWEESLSLTVLAMRRLAEGDDGSYDHCSKGDDGECEPAQDEREGGDGKQPSREHESICDLVRTAWMSFPSDVVVHCERDHAGSAITIATHCGVDESLTDVPDDVEGDHNSKKEHVILEI